MHLQQSKPSVQRWSDIHNVDRRYTNVWTTTLLPLPETRCGSWMLTNASLKTSRGVRPCSPPTTSSRSVTERTPQYIPGIIYTVHALLCFIVGWGLLTLRTLIFPFKKFLKSFESFSYLTRVAAAELRWHLSGMNMIFTTRVLTIVKSWGG